MGVEKGVSRLIKPRGIMTALIVRDEIPYGCALIAVFGKPGIVA